MSAIVPQNGKIRQLDLKPVPDERVTEEYVQDPKRLARLLFDALRDIAALKRRFWPRRLDHEDRTVDATGTTKLRLAHGFNGRVRWWPIDWTGAAGPQLAKHSDTDNNTLVLVSYVAGTVTIRVEEAG